MKKPQISALGKGSDFHDSSLISFFIHPSLNYISIVVSTPDKYGNESLWQIDFDRILRLEFEILGSGDKSATIGAPIEIYEIFQETNSSEYTRWVKRLELLGISTREAKEVKHIVLASSFIRGWGEKEYLEGINIICRDIRIEAVSKNSGYNTFSRPRIEAGPDEF